MRVVRCGYTQKDTELVRERYKGMFGVIEVSTAINTASLRRRMAGSGKWGGNTSDLEVAKQCGDRKRGGVVGGVGRSS